MDRRDFLTSAGIAGLYATRARASTGESTLTPAGRQREADPGSFDPWVEVLGDAIRHNVREIHRFTGRRLLAVIKNNANGIGLRPIGPILDAMDEVYGLAVARVDEALALREEGVRKPILLMAHASDDEAELLVRQDVRLSPFHAESLRQLERLSRRLDRQVAVHLYVDTGMHRVGMPHRGALEWIAEMASSSAVRIEGTYTMFSGAMRDGKSFDEEHLRRFLTLVAEARAKEIELGLLHGAPSTQINTLPQSHQLDLVRPGGAIYGLERYRLGPGSQQVMDIIPVFRLRARVARVERLEAGDGVSFGHRYVAERPTWIATLPVGHTDGYPWTAAGQTKVLVKGRLYPTIGVVSSNHTIIEVGADREIEVGDIATLVGPDDPEIRPKAVAVQTGLDRDYWIMTKLNALLCRRVV